MLFFIAVILMVLGIIMAWAFDIDSIPSNCGIGCAIAGFMLCIIMLPIIACYHLGVEGEVAQMEARYDSLVYQFENDIYDNDNDLGKRELMEDIRKWNETIARKQRIQDNFWIGIFVPNIYDQFELIEYSVG